MNEQVFNVAFLIKVVVTFQLPSINKYSQGEYLFPPEGEYKDGTTAIKSVK